jgi:hypothetical protein
MSGPTVPCLREEGTKKEIQELNVIQEKPIIFIILYVKKKKKKLEKNIKKKEKRDCQEINHQDWP